MLDNLSTDELNAAYELAIAGTSHPTIITGTCSVCGKDLYMDITGQVDICEHFKKAIEDASA